MSENEAGTAEDEQQEKDDKKQQDKEHKEDLDQRMEELEENPPENLEDWPDDDLKMRTFGGKEGNEGYEDGPTQKLGPSDLRYHPDGKITVGGEEVDDPDQYRGDPIPGGPTDPNAPKLAGEGDGKKKSDDGGAKSKADEAKAGEAGRDD